MAAPSLLTMNHRRAHRIHKMSHENRSCYLQDNRVCPKNFIHVIHAVTVRVYFEELILFAFRNSAMCTKGKRFILRTAIFEKGTCYYECNTCYG